VDLTNRLLIKTMRRSDCAEPETTASLPTTTIATALPPPSAQHPGKDLRHGREARLEENQDSVPSGGLPLLPTTIKNAHTRTHINKAGKKER